MALARAEAIARQQAWDAASFRTDMRGHAFILAQEAAAAGFDLVVAVGGDGTVREVAAGLAATGTPMAIATAGSGNSSYLELHGSVPWETILGAVLEGPATRPVDLFQVFPTGEYGLLGFSAGWFAQIVELAASSSAVGPARYVEAAGIAAAAPARFPGTVRVDGVVIAEGDLGLVAIGGARVRASVFPVFPGSSMDDGLLEVLVVRATDTAGFNELLGAVFTGEHLGHPLSSYARGSVVELTAPHGLVAEIDGDAWDRELYQLEARCAPGSLLVAIPRGTPPAT